MNDKGYIKLNREFLSNTRQAARPFSDAEAHLDLLFQARFDSTPTTLYLDAKMRRDECREITLYRGQCIASIRFLSKRWRWSESQVNRFLKKLSIRGEIRKEVRQGVNVITILKYVYDIDGETESETDFETHNEQSDNALQAEAKRKVKREVKHPPETDENNPKKRNTSETKKKNVEERNNNLNPQKEMLANASPKKTGFSLHSVSEDKVDWVALMDFYNTTFSGKLPLIKSVTETRKAAVRARVSQYGKQAIMEVFRKVLASQFLLGGNGHNWRADFDWIFKQANFTKILEGNYDKRADRDAAKEERLADAVEAMQRIRAKGGDCGEPLW